VRVCITPSYILTRISAQGDPKLIYFDARGVVEPSRLLLAAAGVNYEDKRYIVDMSAKPPVRNQTNARIPCVFRTI